MDKKILVICSIRHCTERIVPVLRELRKSLPVDVFCFGEMSRYTPWTGYSDPRLPFFTEFSDISIHGCSYRSQVTHHKTQIDLCKPLNLWHYDIAFIDDNLCKPCWGFQSMYTRFKSHGIMVIAAPHGNRETNEQYIQKNIKRAYDYTFVFGRKERDYIPRLSRRIIPGGIPTNDILANYKTNSKHILVITGFTKGIHIQKGYKQFTESEFYKSGLLDLSQSLGLPIIIKEKRTQKKHKLALSGLAESHDNVSVVMDVEDDNKLICDSACLIAAPSTLCFKAVQKGIPTVLLRKYGMLGSFYDFPAVCDVDAKQINKNLKNQMLTGRHESWIKQSIEGGLEYNSTSKFILRIKKLIRNRVL